MWRSIGGNECDFARFFESDYFRHYLGRISRAACMPPYSRNRSRSRAGMPGTSITSRSFCHRDQQYRAIVISYTRGTIIGAF